MSRGGFPGINFFFNEFNMEINMSIAQIPKDHPDRAALDFIKNQYSATDQDIRGTVFSLGNDIIHGNYITARKINYWSQKEIEELKSVLEKANEISNDFEFVFAGLSDKDDDGDRYYLASFMFYTIIK